MFLASPEITIICICVGIILVLRGWHAIRSKTVMVKKFIGLPWHYTQVKASDQPRLFLFTTWGMIVLGVLFILFPFLIDYLV